VVTNITRENKRLSLRDMNLFADTRWVDLLSGVTVNPEDEELDLVPYQTVWISNEEN
jgi:sucrose phosphorylase